MGATKQRTVTTTVAPKQLTKSAKEVADFFENKTKPALGSTARLGLAETAVMLTKLRSASSDDDEATTYVFDRDGNQVTL